MPRGSATLAPRPAFLAKVQETLHQLVDTGRLPRSEARTLQGYLLTLANTCEGRSGRGQSAELQLNILEGKVQCYARLLFMLH